MVEAGEKDRKGYANDPSSESRYRHIEIIGVGDGGPDFRVRTLIVKADQVVFIEVWIIELSASDVLYMIQLITLSGDHNSGTYRNSIQF